MSLIDWYLRKADQCLRLAAEARDADERAKLEAEGRLGFSSARVRRATN